MASNKKEEKGKLEEQGPKGLEPYRATAQQNAIEAIRSAEKRYAKAKGEGGEHVKAKESSGDKEAGHSLGGSRSAAGEKMHETKEGAGGAASGVAEKGRQAGEYVAEKAGAVKDSVKERARSATDYLGQKTIQVKEKIGEQTQAAQEKLKGMTIGGKEEGGEAAASEERAREGEAAREPGPCHTHRHSRELERACKATKSQEKDAEVVASCGDHHHENKGEKEEGGGGKEEMAGDGEQSSGEGGGVGRVKLTREGGGGGIFQAMGETVVGIMQTARDMIVGRDSH
ncbi:late embryogenesis abundant protein, group 3-like [Nymphaea colorata]|nr:late embryogenesis abundant protein, group 3-like [Nymphaea colorata]